MTLHRVLVNCYFGTVTCLFLLQNIITNDTFCGLVLVGLNSGDMTLGNITHHTNIRNVTCLCHLGLDLNVVQVFPAKSLTMFYHGFTRRS